MHLSFPHTSLYVNSSLTICNTIIQKSQCHLYLDAGYLHLDTGILQIINMWRYFCVLTRNPAARAEKTCST